MQLVNTASLAVTLNNISDALLFERPLSLSDRVGTASWIASRQGLPGSYAGMFAPTPKDLSEGVHLFTGEAVTTRAGISHVLGEEACRALILLAADETEVRAALKRATEGLSARTLARAQMTGSEVLGIYCCAKCSCALWRHLAAGGMDDQERRLSDGMARLRAHRTEKGDWGRFPFYYTLLALSDIDLPSATDELRYAAPACERRLRRLGGGDKLDQRRQALIRKVLERV